MPQNKDLELYFINGRHRIWVKNTDTGRAELQTPGKLEFLALKWTICEKFWDYLFYAQHFTVYTDNNPLTYTMSTAKLNAVGRIDGLENSQTSGLISSTDLER